MRSLWCLALAQLQQLLLLLLLLLPPAESGGDCESGGDLFPADAGLLSLQFAQLKDSLYSGRGGGAAWLLLLYSSFSGYSLAYADEFLQFADSIRSWNHTLRVATLNTAPSHNLAALGHFGLKGLPALLFVPSGAAYGGRRETLLPRDTELLMDELYALLERRVPTLKPFPSILRVYRRFRDANSPIRVIFLEELDGELSRHAVLDFYRSKRVLVAWRRTNRVRAGSVFLTVYTRSRRRRHRVVRRRISVDSLADLKLRIAAEELPGSERQQHLQKQQQQQQQQQQQRHRPATVACRVAEIERRRPTVVDLLSATSGQLQAACPQAWPRVVAFVRLLADLLGRRYAELRPLLALAAELPAAAPSARRWRRLLAASGLPLQQQKQQKQQQEEKQKPKTRKRRKRLKRRKRQAQEPTQQQQQQQQQQPAAVCSGNSTEAAVCQQWLLLQWLTCARAGDRRQQLRPVLPAAVDFLRQCGRPPLAAGMRLAPNASAEEELLLVWRSRSEPSDGRFPSDAECPGCREADVAELLLRWYDTQPPAGRPLAPRAPPTLLQVERWSGDQLPGAEAQDCGSDCPLASRPQDACASLPLLLLLLLLLLPAPPLLLLLLRRRRRRLLAPVC